MTCPLDHIAIIAPSLKDGIVWVRDCLGIAPQMGGAHPQMGTHNMLLRLGDDLFLEVIAIDPNAPQPDHQRWFGLSNSAEVAEHWKSGRRLRGMVARTDRLPALTQAYGAIHGTPMRLTRGEREWQFGVRSDGALPMGGAVPHLMDWGPQGPAAPRLPDLGCRLHALVLETPDPAAAKAHYDAVGFTGMPQLRHGPQIKLLAVIQSPTGIHLLT